MAISRRDFLKGAGATGAGLVMVGLPGCGAVIKTNKPGEGPRYGMVIDLRRCFGCHACSVACKAEQDVPLGYFKSWVVVSEKGRYPHAQRQFVPVLCNHCDDPPCVKACPTRSTVQRDDGIVTQDEKTCIGCSYCIQACPYAVKYRDPRTKTAQKCDFCLHRVDQGILPACVNTCNARARIFGDLNDPHSAVSKLIATNPVQTLRPEMGSEPRVFYIGLDSKAYKPIKNRRKLVEA
ncbi:MAG: twin-arginine translocation signal domain-containing protein [Planctomycetia bacterium]|nr:twin-arginine translocation signal domain-containing protein [Planctomycetia bacterium]